MSYNSGNVNVMKEAVNALPIMKTIIDKVPLMEQVASNGTGSGIVNTSSNGSGNMPMMSKMTKRTAIQSPDYNGVKADFKPAPIPDGSNSNGSGNMPIRPNGIMNALPKMTKRPGKQGYSPAPAPVGKMTPFGYGNPVNPYVNSKQDAGYTQGVNAMTGIQNSINNSIVQPLNEILSSIGEQPILFKTVMYGGGDDDYFDEGRGRAPKTMKVAKIAKRPKLKPTRPMKPYTNPGMTVQAKMANIRNSIMNNMSGIKSGIKRISTQLPCQTCESPDPPSEPQDFEPPQEGGMEGGGRRSRTRHSRMKKSKKTLRNRRS